MCPYDCLTCLNDSTCESCDDSDFRKLDLKTRRCIPIAGYFDNKTHISLSCQNNCKTCNSLTLCTSCVTGTFLNQNSQCVVECSPRYVANTILGICQRCPYDCYRCNLEGNCTACSSTVDNRKLDTSTSRCVPIEGFY